MGTIRVASIILVASWCAVSSFPARPLNERSTELAWQAWLLVDDQNQNHQRQQDPESLRRRITPKSVFIAPSFNQEQLPNCSEGYRPDAMGRCIRIIRIDEAAHLEFLLERLNNQFASMEYEDEMSESEATTTGPYQVNIPLAETQDNQQQQQIAIVVSPTKSLFEDQEMVKRTTELNRKSDNFQLDEEANDKESTKSIFDKRIREQSEVEATTTTTIPRTMDPVQNNQQIAIVVAHTKNLLEDQDAINRTTEGIFESTTATTIPQQTVTVVTSTRSIFDDQELSTRTTEENQSEATSTTVTQENQQSTIVVASTKNFLSTTTEILESESTTTSMERISIVVPTKSLFENQVTTDTESPSTTTSYQQESISPLDDSEDSEQFAIFIAPPKRIPQDQDVEKRRIAAS